MPGYITFIYFTFKPHERNATPSTLTVGKVHKEHFSKYRSQTDPELFLKPCDFGRARVLNLDQLKSHLTTYGAHYPAIQQAQKNPGKFGGPQYCLILSRV
uniref:Uncharacterized protein n=1 Tax=Cacopsylla melanoneura TaxID=428564 RepID=A0A8D8ZIV9_9HEMI